MNREELEAVIRQALARRIASLTRTGTLTGPAATAADNRLVRDILDAAGEYATAQCGIAISPAGRMDVRARRRLAAAMHLTLPGHARPACGNWSGGDWRGTAEPAEVTCHSCQRTTAFEAAA